MCPTCHMISIPQCHIFCARHQLAMKVSWVLAGSFVDDQFSFSLRLISPSKSPPLLSCTTTCHIGVFPTCHIFLCPHQHIFLCRSHCYNLTIKLTTHFVMHHNLPRWCVSNTPHFSVSSLTHICVSLSLLLVTRFRFLTTSHCCIGAITHGSCKEFYRKMDSMRAWLEKKIKSHGSSCKVLDSTLMSNDSSISVVRSIFKWIIIDVFQCNWTYLLTFPSCVLMFSLLLVKRQYCRQNC